MHECNEKQLKEDLEMITTKHNIVLNETKDLTTKETELLIKRKKRKHQQNVLKEHLKTAIDEDISDLIDEIQCMISDIDGELKEIQKIRKKSEEEKQQFSIELEKKKHELEIEKKLVREQSEEISSLDQALQCQCEIQVKQLKLITKLQDRGNKHNVSRALYLSQQ